MNDSKPHPAPFPILSSPQKSEYDLVVFGSGPAGQRAAVQAAKLKKSVLVIEREKIGGSCLHTGTIPSKALREAALAATEQRDIAAVTARTRGVIAEESLIISQQLNRNSVEFVSGSGSFESAHEVKIQNSAGTSKVVLAHNVVIATGTRPRRPNNVRFDSECVFDSDTILQLTEKIHSLAVIGAGVIGCEYASIFARMGIHVVLFDHRHELLRSIDRELVDTLRKHFEKSGIEMRLGFEFKQLNGDCAESGCVQLEFASIERPDLKERRDFDAILYCLGRTGNTEDLDLPRVSLSVNERGLISVNSNYQTLVSHIYAVGDIIGAPGLAASASEQGRLAALHAFTGEPARFPATFPYGIYTIPEMSSVGVQEEELRTKGVDFVVGRAQYRELARGKILGDDHGFLKILVDKRKGTILGVHVVGTGATELIHIGQVAMAFGASVEFFVHNVFNYPTLAEAYKVAALNAANLMRV